MRIGFLCRVWQNLSASRRTRYALQPPWSRDVKAPNRLVGVAEFLARRRASFRLIAGVATIVSLALGQPAWSQVEVTMADGKLLIVDRIENHTDQRFAALKVQNSRISMTRVLPWAKISSVKIGEHQYSRPEFVFALSQTAKPRIVDRAINQKTATKNAKIVLTAPESKERSVFQRNLGVSQTIETARNADEQRGLTETDRPVDSQADLHPGYQRTGKPGLSCVEPMVGTPRIPVDQTPGVIVGVHEDPLQAYAREIKRFFPNGVPVLEAGYVREFMRNYKFYQMVYGPRPLTAPPAGGIPIPLPVVSRNEPSGVNRSVQSIEARVRPISSGGKVDWDALALEIVALDEHRRIVPVDGTLQATLWSSRQHAVPARTKDPYRLFFNQHLQQVGVVASPGRITQVAAWSKPIYSDKHQV